MQPDPASLALATVVAGDRPTVSALVHAVRSRARVPIYLLCGPDEAVGHAADVLVAATDAARISLAESIGRSPDVDWRRPADLLLQAVADLAALPGPPLILDHVEAIARSSAGWSISSLRAVLRRSVARPVVLVLRASGCEQLVIELEGDGRRRLFFVGRTQGGDA